ncbi:MAG: selenocysteine-specific translation elongation factor [Pseudomonadota bacterium]|nr:selenocysteine-specific translation elongation factor [Pseudomonadota bacterium]
MIVATAGHIDHGKTRLVKALTGVDTDRLPEERARGISIDLGFAHADLDASLRVSFIDVPGHERFIRNMLAGVCAIDASLLVVAADDGPMPQTLEHLHILDLIGVRCGAVVITKTDLVPPERVEAVAAEVERMLAATSLAGIPMIPVSTATGVGLETLRQWLREVASGSASPADEGRQFRLAVDRCFTIAGSGTVVTGTVHSGSVAVGDQLRVSPSGSEVRVRGLQVQGTPAAQAHQGQRCALNLAGVAVDAVGRGDWLVHPAAHAPTRCFDARLRVLVAEDAPLAHWTPVHLHLGTADVPARIAVPGSGCIAPGNADQVQIVLERPIAALHGDRFVIRDQGARRTIGGGTVLDPFARRRHRRTELRAAELQALDSDSPAQILRGLLDLSAGGVDLEALTQALNLTPARAAALLREQRAVPLGKHRPVGLSQAGAEMLRMQVLKALRAFHQAAPQASGMPLAALHKAACGRLPAPAFQAFARELANRQAIVLSNDVVRLTEHEATDNDEDRQLWAGVQRRLAQLGVQVPLSNDLARSLGVKDEVLRSFLHRKSRTGDVLRVTAERFCLRETLAGLAATAAELSRHAVDGRFSAAQFRDAIGTGRGLAIHYLELFDRLGITQRFGDQRRIGKDFATVLGSAEPLAEFKPSQGEASWTMTSS